MQKPIVVFIENILKNENKPVICNDSITLKELQMMFNKNQFLMIYYKQKDLIINTRFIIKANYVPDEFINRKELKNLETISFLPTIP